MKPTVAVLGHDYGCALATGSLNKGSWLHPDLHAAVAGEIVAKSMHHTIILQS